jgi:hypothetical protein
MIKGGALFHFLVSLLSGGARRDEQAVQDKEAATFASSARARDFYRHRRQNTTLFARM